MSSSGFVLGFNSPSAVCTVSNAVLLGAGAGIVVRRGDASNQWMPSDGRYPVHKLAYSPLTHLLCVTESRLDVVLHVFRSPDFNCVQRIEEIARVEVQDMEFSPNGQMLAVLACIPSTSVTVFVVQRGRTLEKCVSVDLSVKFWKYLVFPPRRTDSVAVLDSQEVALISQLLLPSVSPNVVSLGSQDREFYSCCWGDCGVLCGLKEGQIVLFDELKMEMHDHLTCPGNSGVTSMLYTNAFLLVGTEDGAVFGYNEGERTLKMLLRVQYSVDRMLLSENGSDAMILTKADVTKLDLTSSNSVVVSARDAGDTVKVLTVGELIIWVSTDGSLMRYDKMTNIVLCFTTQFSEKAVDACAIGSFLVIVYQTGYVRAFTVDTGFTFSSQTTVGVMPLILCESDRVSSLAVSDGSAVYFLALQDGVLNHLGSVDTFTARVKSLQWNLDGTRSVLAACSNGEIHLVRCADAEDGGAQFDAVTVDGVWRLDYPAHDFLPLYVDDDVMNILVHSIDKDTKLYVLERRRERDNRFLRPLFLMRDHEGSGGSVLERFGDTAILSGGADGRVVVRDISHYLLKLAPIPPSKEKRRPRGEFLVRHSGKGGITSLCTCRDDSGFVCGGNDTIVHFIPLNESIRFSWTEPMWRKETLVTLSDTTGKTSEEEPNAAGELVRSHVLSGLAEIRTEIDKLLRERTSAIHVEDFLLPAQRESFTAECELAIQHAREEDYYHLLHNEFTQYTIQRECWDVMEVQRSKIVSLKDLELQVHNFHRRKEKPEEVKLLKKLKFLRMIQVKDKDYFTFSSQLARPESHRPNMPQREGDTEDEFSALLYDSMDVYSNTRAVIQIYLLHGKISNIKESFNARFDSLCERKKRELQRIGERNDRCKRILRQLGEASSIPEDFFFTPVFDIEENPKSVFEVFDSEIDPELLKLAKKNDNNDFVISPTDEAALKTWMDGLEKDTEVIAVKVPLPAFANEALEQYVPPEDRTDEQQKAYEEYEKQLAEETAYVNERKDALREEIKELRKANSEGARVIDEEIATLRTRRIDVAQFVDELESRQLNALRRLFLPTTLLHELLNIIKEKENLQRHLKELQSFEAYKRDLLATEESVLQRSIDEEKDLIVQMRHAPPFDDSFWGDKLYRRFTRWRTKFEEGLVLTPLVEQSDTVPIPLWELYCECCSTIVKSKETIARNTQSVQTSTEALVEVETEVGRVQEEVNEKESLEETYKDNVIRKILDVQNLYCLRQGQVQDEDAMLKEDFNDFSFRWDKDILDYNALIFASFEEISRLMSKVSQQRQAMKISSWEAERLQYCMGTLEMELRQLHTLRVTRQMQECIHTGALASHEEELEKLNRRMEYVREVMSKRVEERNRVIARLNMQINDRRLENTFLGDQLQRVKSGVDDKKTVWDMLGEHNNEEKRLRERMRELYENSELEELARCQQEELVRLKREVDRLRERTFPSFAVVSKKTVI